MDKLYNSAMDGTLVALCALLLTFIGSLWTWNLWLNKQFSSVRALIYDKFDQMLSRLESHEKHDNSRFSDVNNHLWELRLANANNRYTDVVRRGKVLDQETNDEQRQS